MAKLKTAELLGAALDWAVCEADRNIPTVVDGTVRMTPWHQTVYAPSTNSAQGEPLMELAQISVVRCRDLYFPKGNEKGDYYEPYWRATAGVAKQYGPTPLIAAMRCFVALKLGNEVDVPEELIRASTS